MAGQKLGEIFVDIEGRTTKLEKGLKRLKKQSGKTSKKIEKDFSTKANKGFSALKKSVVGLGLTFAGLALGARKALGAMTGFQTAMAEVSTLVNTNTVNMGKLNDKIVELSTRVPKDAVSLSKGLYQTISAGITDVNDALFVLEVASKAAVAGVTETNTSVDAITTVLNAYQLEVSEANKVADIFFTTIREGKTTFPELAAAIGTVASSAALAGIEFSTLGAAFGTLTKFGIDTQLASTALNRLFLSMANPTKQLKDTTRALGVEFSASALRAKGFAPFIKDLTEKFAGNEDAIFALGLDIRAFKALSILGGKGSKEFALQVKKMSDSAGAANTAFGKMNKTVDNSWQLFKNKVSKVFIDLSDTVLPRVTGAIESLAKIFRNSTDVMIDQLEKLGSSKAFIENLRQQRDLNIALEKRVALAKKIQEFEVKRKDVFTGSLGGGGAIGLGNLKELSVAVTAITKERIKQLNAVADTVKQTGKIVGLEKLIEQFNTRRANITKELIEGADNLNNKIAGRTILTNEQTNALTFEAKTLTNLVTEANKLLVNAEARKNAEKTIASLQAKQAKPSNAPTVAGTGASQATGFAPEGFAGLAEIKDKAGKTLEFFQMWSPAITLSGERIAELKDTFDTNLDFMTNKFGAFTNGMLQFEVQTNNRLIRGFANMANAFIAEVERMIAKWAAFKLLQLIPGVGGFIGLITGAGIGGQGHGGGTFQNGKKVASFAGGGSFTVPSGFPNDSFPLLVESGERVSVVPTARAGDESRMLSKIAGILQGQTMEIVNLNRRQDIITAEVNVSNDELNQMVTRASRDRSLFR